MIKLEEKKINLFEGLVLYVGAIGFWALNLIRIFDNEFWADEVYSIHLMDLSVPELISKVAITDSHPPLYYLFLKLLCTIFKGQGGWVYHLSAFIPYTIILIITCTYVKKYFGSIAALVLITLSSIMVNPLVYIVEVRMYSLTAMFDLIAFIAFYKILTEDTKKSWTVFVLASLGTAYSQYYALISVAFLYASLLLACIMDKKYIKKTAICYGATVLAYCPWLIAFIPSFGRHEKGWWLNGIPSVKECVLFMFDKMWIFGIFAIVVIVVLVRNRKEILCPENIWIFAGIMSTVGTAIIGLSLSHIVRPLFLPRYLYPSSAILYLIFGYCISKLKYKDIIGIVLVAALVLMNKRPYTELYWSEYYCNNNTQQFLAEIQPTQGSVIYTNNWIWDWENLDETVLNYYYPQIDHGYGEELLEIMDESYNEVWVYWLSELSEEQTRAIKEKGYSINDYGTKYFATADFSVYKLTK